MKHLYRITWSDWQFNEILTELKPWQMFKWGCSIYKSTSKVYPVIIERLD